jgi:hypothetical protein
MTKKQKALFLRLNNARTEKTREKIRHLIVEELLGWTKEGKPKKK